MSVIESPVDEGALEASARQRQEEGKWTEACELWRECLWRFPHHPGRHWWIAAYAQALKQAGEPARAAAAYRQLQTLFPEEATGFSGLALLLQESGAFDRAVIAWADTLKGFPGHQERYWWLPSFAYAALELGQLEEAEALGEEASSAFPERAGGHGVLGAVAERRFRFEEALAHYEQALQLCSPEERGPLLAGKLRALRELGAIAAYEACLKSELARDGGSIHMLAADAALAEMQGPVEAAIARWTQCIEKRPDRPEGYAGRALLHRAMGAREACEALLRGAIMRWPADQNLRHIMAESLAQWREMDGAQIAWGEALQIAPDSLPLLTRYCAFLGARGLAPELEATLQRRGLSGAPLWQCRFAFAKAARDLDAALDCLAQLRELAPSGAALSLADAEIHTWRQDPGDLEEADRRLRLLQAASPGCVRVKELLSRSLVLRGDAEAAGAVIGSIAAEDRRRAVSEARHWKAVAEGNGAAAQALWQDLSQRFFLPALHLPTGTLRLVRQAEHPPVAGGSLVFSIIRNEYPRLASFLAHYRNLGVTGFVLTDNGSDDGTLDYLSGQSDVTLYQTQESFAQSCYGMRWLNQLIGRHGQESWIVYADADEHLVFPGLGATTLPDFLSRLGQRGHEIVPGVMLDMFPHHMGDANYDWFDPLRIRPSIACPYIEASGGARRRLFGTAVTLSKAPIVWGGAGVRYLSNHATTPGVVSEARVALLHYHLEYLLTEEHRGRMAEEVARGQHSDHAADRRRALRVVEAGPMAKLTGPGSLRYEGPAQLAAIGMIADVKH